MALCKLKRFGNDEPVWLNPQMVVFVEGTDRMGVRIHMLPANSEGVPFVLQVSGKTEDIVKQLDLYGKSA